MDIKKTDVFGGIGVLVIQVIANGILYDSRVKRYVLT